MSSRYLDTVPTNSKLLLLGYEALEDCIAYPQVDRAQKLASQYLPTFCQVHFLFGVESGLLFCFYLLLNGTVGISLLSTILSSSVFLFKSTTQFLGNYTRVQIRVLSCLPLFLCHPSVLGIAV